MASLVFSRTRVCSRFLQRYALSCTSQLRSTVNKKTKKATAVTEKRLKWLDVIDERIHALENIGFSSQEARVYLLKDNVKKIRLETLEKSIDFFKSELKLEDYQVRKVMKYDRILSNTRERLNQIVEILIRDLNCDSFKLKEVVTLHPGFFFVSPELLRSHIETLPEKFEVSRDTFQKAVLNKPAILFYKKSRIDSLYDFLVEKNISKEKIRDIMLFSGLIYNNSNLGSCLEFLKVNLELTDEEVQNLIIQKSFSMNYFRPILMERNYKFLLSEFGGSKDLIKRIVMKQPYLLTMQLKVMKPKLDYFREHMGKTDEDLVKECSVLGCTLERIMTRHKFLLVHGCNPKVKFPSLLQMLVPGDKLFLKRYCKHATLEQFYEFKKNFAKEQN